MKKESILEFAVTNYCQAKCPSCNRTDPETLELNPWIPLTHFDVDLFKKTVSHEYAEKRNLIKIKFCGEAGDPMMHPKITDFIDHAFDIGVKSVTISTNGALRTPAWYTRMGETYGHRLQIVFGIDGVDHETNIKYRIGVDTDRAFENMIAFHEAGGNAKWQFILFNFNYHQLPQVADIKEKHGMGAMVVWNMGNHGLIPHDERPGIKEKYQDELDRIKNNYDKQE